MFSLTCNADPTMIKFYNMKQPKEKSSEPETMVRSFNYFFSYSIIYI